MLVFFVLLKSNPSPFHMRLEVASGRMDIACHSCAGDAKRQSRLNFHSPLKVHAACIPLRVLGRPQQQLLYASSRVRASLATPKAKRQRVDKDVLAPGDRIAAKI